MNHRNAGRRNWTTLVACALLLGLSLSCEEFEQGPPLVVQVFGPQGQAPIPIVDELTACDGSGSTTNPVDRLTLQPTSGNPDFCCCRVVGRVVNQSTVAIHALVKVSACVDGDVKPIGAAVDFLSTVVPDEDRPLNATGLLKPCNEIDRVELVEVDLNGVVFP